MIANDDNPIVPLHVRSGYSLARGTVLPERLVALARGMGHAALALTDVNGLYGAPVFWDAATAADVQPLIGAELLDAQGHSLVALVCEDVGYENLCRVLTRIHCEEGFSLPHRLAEFQDGLQFVLTHLDAENGSETSRSGGSIPKAPRLRRGDPSEIQQESTGRSEVSPRRSRGAWEKNTKERGNEFPFPDLDPDRVWMGVDPGMQSEPEIHARCAIAEAMGIPIVATATALLPDPADLDLAHVLTAIRMGTVLDGEPEKWGLAPERRAVGRGGACPHFSGGSPATPRKRGQAPAGRTACPSGASPLFRSSAFPPGSEVGTFEPSAVHRGRPREQSKTTPSSPRLRASAAHSSEASVLNFGPSDFEFVSDFGLRISDFRPVGGTLRPPAVLRHQLAHLPQAITNNRRLVERCSGFRLRPRMAVFPRFDCTLGRSVREELRHRCREGVRWRYGELPAPPVEARIERELRVIERMGFSEYFLVVWDIVRHARSLGAPVAGRGSGASSLVAYVLGITNVCPVALNIPFERFLHEKRQDFPDLDIDFCWRIRDDVIDYAFARWGHDRVAMVCTHNCFQPRSALREAAKAMGFSDEQISAGRALESDPRFARVRDLARRLVGLPHLLSVHPGGIVIGRKPIDHYAPLQVAAKGVRITQYDKDGVEAMGLVKLDLLGNRNLSTIHAAAQLVRTRTGEPLDVEALPPDDPRTLSLLRSADTLGCNQLESPAMRNLLQMMQPAGLRDVMKALALIRPGAASLGMKEAFIRRHRRLDPVPPGWPATDSLLHDTHGIMLYEDDVMLTAAALLDSDLPTGDRFRKAVQKCRDDTERLRLSREFLTRARAAGAPDDCARSLWVQMAKFNAYSFCRAHAASYALLAYAGAYLKAHHPLEFWTAALNNNQSMYAPRTYVDAARRAGVRFLLPDANRSLAEFAPEGHAIRTGLNFVDGLGAVGAERILDARERGGPFASLTDFLLRARLGAEEARALVLCGALDFTHRNRPTLMMELNLFFRVGPGRGGPAPAPLLSVPAPVFPDPPGDYDERRKILDEFRILGLSLRLHTLELYRPLLQGVVDGDFRDLRGRVGKPIRLAGMLEALRTTRTERGDTMMFLTLSDEHGLFEATVFPDALRRTRTRFDRYGPYVVAGRVEEQYGALNVAVEEVWTVGEDSLATVAGAEVRTLYPHAISHAGREG